VVPEVFLRGSSGGSLGGLRSPFFLEVVMHNSSRGHVHKGKSAAHFRHDVGRTHPRNAAMAPRRGGWRL
jgi:hypothetical protein